MMLLLLGSMLQQKRDTTFLPGGYSSFITKEGQKLFGKKVVLLYEKKFGLCPYYNNSDPNQPVNGGLPQNASLHNHLHQVVKDILTTIPDQWFDGLAVIDLEEWRPLYDMNWEDKEVGSADIAH
ncbi:hyaluronoglucosaminidase, partial [Ostertagia ostertagi]